MIPLGVLSQRQPAGGTFGAFVATYDTTYTGQTGAALGTPNAARVVIVSVSWRHSATNARQPTAMTIAGVSATNAASTPAWRSGAAIYYASVPAGTTGDIAVTWNAAVTYARFGVYETRGTLTAAGYVAVDNVSTVHTVTLDPTSAGEFVVAAAANYAPETIDLTAGVTEDTDGTYLVHGHGFASGATHDVTAVGSGTFHNRLAAASFTGA